MNNTNADIEYLRPEQSEEELKPAERDFIDHIMEILAADYFKSMVQTEEEEEEEESP